MGSGTTPLCVSLERKYIGIDNEQDYYEIPRVDKLEITIENVGEVFVNKILQGDCLDVMKDIDNDTFDIVVSSPPYNIGMNYNTYDDNQVDYVDWQKFGTKFVEY